MSLEDVSCEGKYFSLEKLIDGTLKLKCDYSYYLQCHMHADIFYKASIL